MAVTICLIAGCKNPQTGLHVTVHFKDGAGYDELRFGVTDVADPTNPVTLVDPHTAGRKTGLAAALNPDVVVLLDDNVDGHELICDVEVLQDGQPIGSGLAPTQARAHQIREVHLYPMGAPADAAVDADHGGSGGYAGGSGGSGGSGAGGYNGAGGSGSGGSGTTGTGGASGSSGTAGAGGGSGAGGADGSGGNTGMGGKTGSGARGSSCTDGEQCASGFCVDTVCCESSCTGACTTCNFNKGMAGICRAAMNHVLDPHHVCVDTGAGNCGTDGTCDNAGLCAIKTGACTPACASDTSRYASGTCTQTGCVGLGMPIACPANISSCVAGACQ